MRTVIDGRAIATFNQREQVIARLKFTVVNHNKLTASQMEIYTLIWHDLVEFTN